ncbi:hypothetical protein PAPYR_10018 [Paratrimastix pyriformis]|uniref:Uncharacterized protein n=1 Tax=Paratrimastix pyriformis TaxID=342808 RepID=A0ABQ8U717_9EUKA|nr:hypothetical protein PAPYR_10018 [Paratrimastix pyriformis]
MGQFFGHNNRANFFWCCAWIPFPSTRTCLFVRLTTLLSLLALSVSWIVMAADEDFSHLFTTDVHLEIVQSALARRDEDQGIGYCIVANLLKYFQVRVLETNTTLFVSPPFVSGSFHSEFRPLLTICPEEWRVNVTRSHFSCWLNHPGYTGCTGCTDYEQVSGAFDYLFPVGGSPRLFEMMDSGFYQGSGDDRRGHALMMLILSCCFTGYFIISLALGFMGFCCGANLCECCCRADQGDDDKTAKAAVELQTRSGGKNPRRLTVAP